jgi:hypothetical protein
MLSDLGATKLGGGVAGFSGSRSHTGRRVSVEAGVSTGLALPAGAPNDGAGDVGLGETVVGVAGVVVLNAVGLTGSTGFEEGDDKPEPEENAAGSLPAGVAAGVGVAGTGSPGNRRTGCADTPDAGAIGAGSVGFCSGPAPALAWLLPAASVAMRRANSEIRSSDLSTSVAAPGDLSLSIDQRPRRSSKNAGLARYLAATLHSIVPEL